MFHTSTYTFHFPLLAQCTTVPWWFLRIHTLYLQAAHVTSNQSAVCTPLQCYTVSHSCSGGRGGKPSTLRRWSPSATASRAPHTSCYRIACRRSLDLPNTVESRSFFATGGFLSRPCRALSGRRTKIHRRLGPHLVIDLCFCELLFSPESRPVFTVGRPLFGATMCQDGRGKRVGEERERKRGREKPSSREGKSERGKTKLLCSFRKD